MKLAASGNSSSHQHQPGRNQQQRRQRRKVSRPARISHRKIASVGEVGDYQAARPEQQPKWQRLQGEAVQAGANKNYGLAIESINKALCSLTLDDDEAKNELHVAKAEMLAVWSKTSAKPLDAKMRKIKQHTQQFEQCTARASDYESQKATLALYYSELELNHQKSHSALSAIQAVTQRLQKTLSNHNDDKWAECMKSLRDYKVMLV